MAFNLFGPTRKKSRRGGGRSGIDTVLTIATIGAVGIVGYWVFVEGGGKGVQEAKQTFGEGLKNATDAITSTLEYAGKESSRVTGWIHGVEEGRQGALESIGNTGCHIQRGFGILLSPFGVKPLECRGSGNWTNKGKDEDDDIIEKIEKDSPLQRRGILDTRDAFERRSRNKPKKSGALDFLLGIGCGVVRDC